MNNKINLGFIGLILIIFSLLIIVPRPVLSDPDVNATNATAQGGNVTSLNFGGATAETSIWQGYFGSVSGGFSLTNANGDSFYDWSVVSAVGEIIAVRQEVTDWSGVKCTNQSELYNEEYRLDITNATEQGINDTYQNLTHPSFNLASTVLSGCRSTRTNNQTVDQSQFWNVLININSSMVGYVALLDDNEKSFNGTTVDFQLLVPINASKTTSEYKIYVELG
jgi:hypothetical protein